MTSISKPVVLHIGDRVQHNLEVYERFASEFTIIHPPVEERRRPEFIQALKDRRWGNFDAIFRPFWGSGGEMGRWDKDLVPLLPKSVKVFASAGAGYDWADVDVLAEHGIVYCNGAAASSEAVADMAIFHILSVFRNITWSQLAARSGDPDQWADAHKRVSMSAHNPKDHIVGIIGLGNIGYTIAKKAFLCFGSKIYYHDVVRISKEREEAIKATYFDSLDELLGVSDCVVLAVPYGGKTLIDAERLSKFKPGSRFVNIARGTLADEAALVDALKSGHLSAAGLDVYENEPHIHPELLKFKNVSLTCHNAGGAIETRFGFERLAMENIEGLLLRGKAHTPVNLHLIKKDGA